MNETYEMGYGFPKPFKLFLTPCVIASDLSKIQTHKHTQAYKPTHIYIINGKKTSSSLFIKCMFLLQEMVLRLESSVVQHEEYKTAYADTVSCLFIMFIFLQEMVLRLESSVVQHEEYKTAYSDTVSWISHQKSTLQRLGDSSGDKEDVEDKLQRVQVSPFILIKAIRTFSISKLFRVDDKKQQCWNGSFSLFLFYETGVE